MLQLDPHTLDVIQRIRLNGFEVDLRPGVGAQLLTVFDPTREAESSFALAGESLTQTIQRLIVDYCTPEQQSQLLQADVFAA